MEDIEPWDCMVFAISILVDNSSESHMGYSISANLDPSRISITIPPMPHKTVLMSRNTHTLSQEVFICLLVRNNWRYWNRSMFSKEKSFYKQHVSTFHSKVVTSCRWYHRLEKISCHFYYYYFFNLNLKNIFQTILIVSRGERESYHILVALENWLNLSPNSREHRNVSPAK